ncbi:MAG: aminopeptidase P family protein [Chloroflexi bacterium]|nr:aminopeptidase P family protein [Chloroflexota bacterium]
MSSPFVDKRLDIAQVPVQATPSDELAARASRLQEAMRTAELGGVMATQNADIFYLSGVVQQAQLYLPVSGEPLLMVRKHLGRAQSVSRLGEMRVVGVRSLKELPGLVEGAGGRPDRIGFELDTLPVSIFNAYSKALSPLGAELVDASNLFRQVRSIKSDYEIAQIRKAAEVAEVGLRTAAEHLHEGMREIELASLVEAATRIAGHSGAVRIRAYGQEMHMGHLLAGDSGALASFMNSPTGGYGPGPWAPYGAGSRQIKRGEPVLLDYSGEWGGYIADQTRMLSIGKLSHFWLDAYEAMRDVARYLEQEVRPGVTSGDVYDMALQRATALGYGDNFMGPPEKESPGQKVPFVGHGVGLELDEYPPLQRGATGVLQKGMALAVEPKLIFTGRGAIGIEDTYLLSDAGLSHLTFSQRELVVV